VKFEGSLDAFSLPDIFQLLSFTKKSGGLRLRHGQAEGVVWFIDGFVTGATSDVAHQALARRIAGIGLASAEDFRAAVERSTGTGGTTGVARALLDAGAVDAAVLHATVTAQAIDAVSELLRWPTGDFTLVDGANPDDVGVVVASDQIVTEAISRSAAWEALAEVLPSPDVVLVLRPVAPDQDAVLKPEEWSLVALVDGRRTVGSIVALTGRGQFSVVSTLAELVRRGLLYPRGVQDPVAELEAALAQLAPLEASSAPGFEQETETWTAPAAHVEPLVESFVELDVEPVVEPSAPSDVHVPGPFAAPVPSPIAAPVVDEPVLDEPVLDAPAPSLTLALSRIDQDGSTRIDDTAEIDDPVQDADDADDDDAEAPVLPRLGGPHVPGDVVPPRVEPFLPARQPDHPEAVPAVAARLAGLASVGGGGASRGSAAVAADPQASSLIERDPSVNRSLLLRLIAGVRGL
jgi:Domain of unknown function (DUF4388)